VFFFVDGVDEKIKEKKKKKILLSGK